MSSLLYKIALSFLPNFGPVRIRYLISHLGSVDAIFEADKKKLAKIPNIGSKIIENLDLNNALELAKKEIDLIEQNNIEVLFYLDSNFPKQLVQYDDLPIILFVKGKIDLTKGKFLSIVGTRNMTSYGQNLCYKIVEELAQMQIPTTIVSGLAYGVDYTAHNAAIKNGLKTIACIGNGLGVVYPASHRELYSRIVENGAIISEFPFSTQPHPANFVRRNRIIAALSEATLVVESAKGGGALITAEFANSYNREVMTFPGKVADKMSEGCNWLIKTNKANLIENAQDLVDIMNWKTNKKPIQTTIFHNFTKEESLIVEFLKTQDSVNIDVISYETNLPINVVMSTIFQLEFNNVVLSMPGRMYKLMI